MSRPERYNEDTVPEDAMKYLRARRFIEDMKKHIRILHSDEYKVMRRQALSGDVAGAEERLRKIVRERL